MASTTFVHEATRIPAAWANDVNNIVYNVLGNPGSVASLKATLGIQPSGGSNTGIGTIASQNRDAVNLTGGNIDGIVIGATTPALAHFSRVVVTTAPVGASDLVNKQYVDYQFAQLPTIPVVGSIASQNSNNVTITGGSIRVSTAPVNALDVATKQYVDSIALDGQVDLSGYAALADSNVFAEDTAFESDVLVSGELRADTIRIDSDATEDHHAVRFGQLAEYVPVNALDPVRVSTPLHIGPSDVEQPPAITLTPTGIIATGLTVTQMGSSTPTFDVNIGGSNTGISAATGLIVGHAATLNGGAIFNGTVTSAPIANVAAQINGAVIVGSTGLYVLGANTYISNGYTAVVGRDATDALEVTTRQQVIAWLNDVRDALELEPLV